MTGGSILLPWTATSAWELHLPPRTRERGEQPGAGTEAMQAGAAMVAGKAGAALAAGVDPASAEGQAILAALLADWAAAGQTVDSPEFRARLLTNLQSGTDRRAERYWQLLGSSTAGRRSPRPSRPSNG